MITIEKISSSLFDKIRSRFDDVSLGDEKSKSTVDPEKARFINFTFVSGGRKIGNVTISLIDGRSLKIYFSKDISSDMTTEEQKEWFDFLRSLRLFAKRNLLTFDTRDIAKKSLQLKDIEQQSQTNGIMDVDDLKESRMYGNKRQSFEDCGTSRIIVRHSKPVEEAHGARSRNIDSVFIETAQGERFLMPFKNLHGARAMARHLSEGGKLDDEIGSVVSSMCTEMSDMAHFVRKAKRFQFEDAETEGMAKAAVDRYNELKTQLRRMHSPRGYMSFKESYVPSENSHDDYDMDALRERFVKKIYDEKLDKALPYVYSAYQQQQSRNTQMANDFEDWANHIVEGTWSLPSSEADITELDQIMKHPLPAGDRGTNAAGVLYNIIGSDSLNDAFDQASANDPETDVRPIVLAWLKEFKPEIAQRYSEEQLEVPSELQASTTYGASTMDEPKTESLDPILRLAGIRK